MPGRHILQRTGITLALLALLLPLLYVADFTIERALHRREVRRQMRQASLQTLVMPVQDIQWIEKDREILVRGEYFDVEAIRHENGRAFITGFFDRRETDLHRAFAGQGNPDKQSGGTAPLMARWLQQLWDMPTAAITPSPPALASQVAAQHLHAALPGQPACPPEQPPRPSSFL